MSPDEARDVLGLTGREDADGIRARYRHLIAVAHPDRGGDGAAAARINEALDVLTRSGTDPVDPPRAEQPADGASAPPGRSGRVPASVADRTIVLDVAPRELLDRIVESGADIGEVAFVDPENGVIEIIVGSGRATGQLLVTVGRAVGRVGAGSDEVPVAFALEALDPTSAAEPIGEVVDRLLAAVRRRA